MEFEIKYDDGTRERVFAEKYDSVRGIFLDNAKNVVAHVNTEKTKLIKVVKEDKVSA